MEVEHGSIVDTVIKFAKQFFGVTMEVDDVRKQLMPMKFSEQQSLMSAMQEDDKDDFLTKIKLPSPEEKSVEEAGIVRPGMPTPPTDARTNRFMNKQVDDARPTRVSSGNVAGGNKTATGNNQKTPPPPAPDAQGQQRQANSQGIQQNAQSLDDLQQQVARLQQLATGKR